MRRRHSGSMLLLAVLCSLCLAAADSAAEMVKLKGSGASFPFPLYGRWFKDYGKVNKQVQVDYQAKGSGAGATFPAPLYKKWLEEYQKRQLDVQLSYDALGSGEGTKRFMAGAVDFGASDAAMSDAEMAVVARGVQLLPDHDGQESYPIVTFSWLLLYKQYDDHRKAAALKQYVKWCLTEGQAFNQSGSVPLVCMSAF